MLFLSTLSTPKNKIFTQEADPGVSVSKAQILFVPHGNFYGNVNAGSSDVFLMKINSSGVVQ
jgi:hypothetical protein